ncbi:hypothetical protein IWW39_003989, partial [Coemansia spiralis]
STPVRGRRHGYHLPRPNRNAGKQTRRRKGRVLCGSRSTESASRPALVDYAVVGSPVFRKSCPAHVPVFSRCGAVQWTGQLCGRVRGGDNCSCSGHEENPNNLHRVIRSRHHIVALRKDRVSASRPVHSPMARHSPAIPTGRAHPQPCI